MPISNSTIYRLLPLSEKIKFFSQKNPSRDKTPKIFFVNEKYRLVFLTAHFIKNLTFPDGSKKTYDKDHNEFFSITKEKIDQIIDSFSLNQESISLLEKYVLKYDEEQKLYYWHWNMSHCEHFESKVSAFLWMLIKEQFHDHKKVFAEYLYLVCKTELTLRNLNGLLSDNDLQLIYKQAVEYIQKGFFTRFFDESINLKRMLTAVNIIKSEDVKKVIGSYIEKIDIEKFIDSCFTVTKIEDTLVEAINSERHWHYAEVLIERIKAHYERKNYKDERINFLLYQVELSLAVRNKDFEKLKNAQCSIKSNRFHTDDRIYNADKTRRYFTARYYIENDENIALVEALILKGQNFSVTEEHATKIFDYLERFDRYYIVVYYKGEKDKFDSTWNSYKENIEKIEFPPGRTLINPQFAFVNLNKNFDNIQTFKVAKTCHENNVEMFHIMADFSQHQKVPKIKNSAQAAAIN